MSKKIHELIYCIFLKRKYIYWVVLLMIFLLYVISLNYMYKNNILNGTLQAMSDVSNIILSIFSIIGVVFTLLYAVRQYEAEKRHRKISKAADLAKLYADELLLPISKIISELSIDNSMSSNKNEFNKIFDKIVLDEIFDFNKKELDCKLKEDEILFYKFLVNRKIKVEKNSEELPIHSIIGRTLNRIEYFCIYFNSGIAEDMTVYQSLHQTFFEVIKYTYVYIATQNVSESDKYYTNIIETYIRWRKIYKEKICEIEKENKKLQLAEEKRRKRISEKTKSPSVDS